jgi:PadR family transcriptional regulator, regulatory protein AphA
MSLPHALLGLLSYKPATGYDLKVAFASSIGMFWDASLPQIYRTLGQMEKNGWLSFRIEQQEGKPNRKIYNLTASGKKELNAWLRKTLEFPQVRKNDMLMKIFFGNKINQKDLIEHFKKWRSSAAKLQEKLEKGVKPVVAHYSDVTGAKDDMYFWLLTADYGRRRAKMIVEWCDSALGFLEKGKKYKYRFID